MRTRYKLILIAAAIVVPWLFFSPVERLFYAVCTLIPFDILKFVTGLVFMSYVMWDMFCIGVLIHVVGNSWSKQLEK